MKQTAAANEKIDPLMRIQEEIKEVERREQEYRQLISTVTNISVNECENESLSTNDKDLLNGHDENHNDSLQSMSPTPPINGHSMMASNDESNSSMPSLALSVNSTKEDDHHSDDSGISASSSPVNGVSANIKKINEANKVVTTPSTPLANREPRYIGPNCYNLTPEPPQQKLMTRTVSTPLLSAIKAPRQFTLSPAHKGVMQRFIASRGKLQMNNNNNSTQNKIFLNGKNAAAVLGINTPGTPPNTPMTPMSATIGGVTPDFNARNPVAIIPTVTLSPPVVERDSEGRPIRPGYVPVELKIQRELQDLKSREHELKKIRKIRQSTPDLLDSIDNENIETDDEDSDVEHCYGPGKLRAAKSIGDMCDAQNNNNSRSVSPMPEYDKQHQRSTAGSGNGGMRPAVSLAQLCDLDPQEAPSSRGLIAQWENLIQQNA
ncbi:mitotic spindle positioning protein meduse [Cochliomyia hominivorax]